MAKLLGPAGSAFELRVEPRSLLHCLVVFWLFVLLYCGRLPASCVESGPDEGVVLGFLIIGGGRIVKAADRRQKTSLRVAASFTYISLPTPSRPFLLKLKIVQRRINLRELQQQLSLGFVEVIGVGGRRTTFETREVPSTAVVVLQKPPDRHKIDFPLLSKNPIDDIQKDLPRRGGKLFEPRDAPARALQQYSHLIPRNKVVFVGVDEAQ